MNLKYRSFFIVFIGLFLINFVNANSWNLKGIDIISREERGADHSFLFSGHDNYQTVIEKNIKYKKYIDYLKIESPSLFVKEMQRIDIERKRKKYLEENFSDEIKIDKLVDELDGKELRWEHEYKENKTKIIIHHTATDMTNRGEKNDIEEIIQNIYYYHTFTKGWGDIGYNFLIDSYGNIHEGRNGGESIVGIHTKRNNISSIGIALIGNFEIDKPTDEAINSLTNLISALAIKYKIDPKKRIDYHRDDNEEPHIEDIEYNSIAGHSDAGHTLCPGKYLYELIPNIIETAKLNFDKGKIIAKNSNKKKNKLIRKDIINGAKVSNSKYINIKHKIDIKDFDNKCYFDDKNLKITKCEYKKGILDIKIKYIKGKASGYKYIIIPTKEKQYKIKVKLVWVQDLQYIIDEIKEKYEKNNSKIKIAKYKTNKISEKINLEEAKKKMNEDIKVLLYELSTEYDKWDINCHGTCNVNINGIDFENINNLTVKDKGNNLEIYIDSIKYNTKSIKIYGSDLIEVSNYDRKSYVGIPWNTFKGNMSIHKDKIKILNKGVQEKFVIVNELPFNDYMEGIAETNDQDSLEKIKAMSLIIKSYTLFYSNSKNIHPSVPQDSKYNAVDDPRIFQKYVGAGFEKTVKKWYEALGDTKNEIVLYDNYVPILPYFNCSAGFTYSAKDKFGRTDTPYLKEQIDFYKCKDFNGHGVGLSGKGAELMAKKGVSYKKIIKWFYNGVEIKKIY